MGNVLLRELILVCVGTTDKSVDGRVEAEAEREDEKRYDGMYFVIARFVKSTSTKNLGDNTALHFDLVLHECLYRMGH